MATRVVEGRRPYTGGKAITVDENRVISLNLRGERNLIIWDEGDNEIYVDLQLPDGRTPIDAFPVGVNTGRVSSEDGWDVTGTIISAETTSGDNIKILYGDDGTLWIDNGTGTFKQIYFKGDVDLLISTLQSQIDVLSGLGKFLSLWDCVNGEPMSFPLETPYEYSTGDYYLIGNVSSATPPVNYRPAGDEWIDDDPSTKEPESATVERGDTYIYDGTVWLLQKNTATGGTGTGDVTGPNSAVDGHLALFNGTTGKLIKDGGVPFPGMTILSYGSSTWSDFITAYNNNAIVYCKASSNSNPGTGTQSRLAFMAYVNNPTTPTSVEFQYYRSRSTSSYSDQTDEVYVYKLDNQGTWTVETRKASVKIVAGTGLDYSYNTSNREITLTPTVVSGDSGSTYTIKVANADPASGTPATTITFVL